MLHLRTPPLNLLNVSSLSCYLWFISFQDRDRNRDRIGKIDSESLVLLFEARERRGLVGKRRKL